MSGINKKNLENKLIVCGPVIRNEINSYYSKADFTILASISEGFGLSIVEGFAFGLPSITFKDLDAIPDLFDPKTMWLIEERTDKALSDGIAQILSMPWDKEYIKKHAQKFTPETMAKKYIELYGKLVN